MMLGPPQILAHSVNMDRNRGCIALLLFFALHPQGVTTTTARQISLSQDLVTSNGTRAVYATLNGVPHWRLLPHLWVDKTVRLHWTHGKVRPQRLMQMHACCAQPSLLSQIPDCCLSMTCHMVWLSGLQLTGQCCEQDVGVYVAPDLGQLERRIDRKERVWCGWEHFLGGPDNECMAHVNPFGQSVIAIADHKDKSHFKTGTRILHLSNARRMPLPA